MCGNVSARMNMSIANGLATNAAASLAISVAGWGAAIACPLPPHAITNTNSFTYISIFVEA